MLFQAPVSEVLEWDEEKIAGVQRWFSRLWQVSQDIGSRRAHGSETPDLNLTNDAAAELWKSVQSTIISVTQSFAQTYALNTVISDLMSLTNTLNQAISNPALPHSDPSTSFLLHSSCSTLLRLLAPIAPSFVEECWINLHNLNNTNNTTEAHKTPFPTPDGSLEKLQARSMPCACQVNGKLKFVAHIATPPAEVLAKGKEDELRSWVLQRVAESKEGAEAAGSGKWRVGEARKVVVVRGGRTVNLVL